MAVSVCILEIFLRFIISLCHCIMRLFDHLPKVAFAERSQDGNDKGMDGTINSLEKRPVLFYVIRFYWSIE